MWDLELQGEDSLVAAHRFNSGGEGLVALRHVRSWFPALESEVSDHCTTREVSNDFASNHVRF